MGKGVWLINMIRMASGTGVRVAAVILSVFSSMTSVRWRSAVAGAEKCRGTHFAVIGHLQTRQNFQAQNLAELTICLAEMTI